MATQEATSGQALHDLPSIELENGEVIPQRNGHWYVCVRARNQQDGGGAIICQRGSEEPYLFPSLQAAFTCLKTMNH